MRPARHHTPGFGLPRTSRVIRARDFRRIYNHGLRAHGEALVVVAWRRHQPGHRLGLSVSKAHGAAVRRNKIKRILREAFRLQSPALPGRFDMILIPRVQPGHYRLGHVREELVRLVHELASRRPRRPGKHRAGRSER